MPLDLFKEEETLKAQPVDLFRPIDLFTEEETQIPFWQKAVKFMTMGHIDPTQFEITPSPPTGDFIEALTGDVYTPRIAPEVQIDPETGEQIITPSPGVRMPIFEEPTGLPLAGILFPAARAGVPLGRKALGALREAVGWMTGGISEAPLLIKGGAKGVGKLAEAKAAKPLEKTLAPAQARAAKGVGVKPTITAAEEIPSAVVAPLGRESEYLKGVFEERFIKGKPKGPLEPIATKRHREPVGGIKEQIKSIIQDDDSGLAFGIRVLPLDIPTPQIGDKLKSSFKWIDGTRQEKRLGATSTIGISSFDEAGIVEALHQTHGPWWSYEGETVALVRGKFKAKGSDPGEYLIKDPEVMTIFKKSDLPEYTPEQFKKIITELRAPEKLSVLSSYPDETGKNLIFSLSDGSELSLPIKEVEKVGIYEAYDKVLEIKKGLKSIPKPPPTTTLRTGIPLHEIGQVGKAWEKTVGTASWDKAIMKGIPKALEKVPGGKAVNRAFLREYRGNLPNTEKYIKSLDEKARFQAVGREYGLDLGKRLQQFPEDAQLRMGEFIRGEIKKLPASEFKVAQEAKQTLYDLGKQAVDSGLLSEETFFKHAGKYMPRLYTTKEYQSLLTRWGLTKPNRLDLSRFKKRNNIPKEIREQMGEILTPGYPVAKGIVQLTHDIELSRFFKGISDNADWARPARKFDVLPADVEGKTWGAWEGDTNLGVFNTRKEALAAKNEALAVYEAANPVPEGWKKLPSNKKLGNLSDAYVHPEIFGDLQETIRVMETPEKVWRKTLGYWKFGKVIISPKTHVRNLFSNSILAHIGGMPLPMQPIYLTKAAKAMRGKTDLWKAAKQEGLLATTFTQGELRTLFDAVDIQLAGIKAGSMPEALGAMGTIWEKGKGTMRKAANLYEAEEQWFKMAKFIHNVERKGMDFKAAAADAEKWLFNYSKLTKFQEKYKAHPLGAPFATFTFKAIPRVAEAAIKTPWRFALPMAMIYSLERATMAMLGEKAKTAKAKRALFPDYMKTGLDVIGAGWTMWPRVPIIDEHGREYPLNLTYMLPWGDIAEGGGFGPIPGGIMPFTQPGIKTAWEQIANYNLFYKKPIVREEAIAGKPLPGRIATEAKLRGAHIVQSLLPTPVLDVPKSVASLRGKPDIRGRVRPLASTLADALLGMKTYPVDYADQVARLIAKEDPKSGYLARRIRRDIEILGMKRKAMADKGGDVSSYDKQIEKKVQQLIGLGEGLKKKRPVIRKALGLTETKIAKKIK